MEEKNQKSLKRKIFSGLGWKFGERVLNQGITFVVSLVLARILDPSDYGLIAEVNIFIALANVFVVNGFSAALIQKEDADSDDFSSMLLCSFGVSCLLYLVLYLAAPLIALLFDSDKLVSVVRILSLILPLSSCNAIWNALLSRKMEFREIFIATLIGTIVSGTVGIVMAVSGYGVWSLVVQMILNQLVSNVVLIKLSGWLPSLVFSKERVAPMLRFGSSVLGADFVGTVFNQLNAFVIGLKYSDSQLAYYNRGQSIPYMVSGIFNSVSAGVYFPALSRLNGDIARIKDLTRISTKLFAYILLPFYFGMIAVSDNMILVLLTEKWIDASPFLRIVCVASIIGTIAPLDLQMLKAYGRSDVVFKLEFIKKPLWAMFTLIALLQNSIIAIAWVLPLATLMETVLNSFQIQRMLDYSISEKARDWIEAAIPSILMFVVVQLMNMIEMRPLFLLVIQIAAGILTYLLFSIVVKNKQYQYLMGMIKSRL